MAKHLGILPLYNLKDNSESNNSSLKKSGLIDSTHVNNIISGGNFSTKKQDTVECGLSLKSIEIDNSIATDVKPDIKDLSDIISNCDTDTVISNISPFIQCDLRDMESIENMSINMNQDKIKQETESHPESSDDRVKEEIMYCQSCSNSDIDFGKLKFHILREHPTGAAVVANSFDKANCYLYDIILFCIKESCSFSTSQCNVYEEHLMSCCLLKETLSEDEKEKLKSTVKFILDFKNKHNLNTVPGFQDYFSTFITTFTSKDNKVQINKDLEDNSSSMLSGPLSVLEDSVRCANVGTKSEDSISSFPTPVLTRQNTDFNRTLCKIENTSLFEGEQERKPEQLSKPASCNVTFTSSSEGGTALIQSGDDHDVSENIALEIDVAGSPIDINSLKEETEGNKIKEMKMYYTADCCTKDLHVSNQQFECMTRMTTETQPIDHTSDLYNDVIQMDTGHFNSDMKLDSSGLNCDMKEKFGKQSFKISEDLEKYDYSMDFIQHKRNYTKREKPFNVRGMKFAQNAILIKPSRSPTEDKPFKCIDCGKTFDCNSHLIEHIKTHRGKKILKCNDCGKTFDHYRSFNKHRRIHTTEKPLKCNVCGKTFGHNSSLIRHRRTHTGEKQFKCNDCEKNFHRKSSLILHMRTHTGEKPFKCNGCEKTFSQKSNLIEHMRIHTGEKSFKCTECGRTFGHNSHLIAHKRTHTGEKPFKCNDCEKTFGHSNSLNYHRRTHTEENPFKCNGCVKTFSQKCNLIKHTKSHTGTGEKSFKCNDCGKTFGHSSSLIYHRRTHTGEKPFKCNECGKTFGQNSHLVKHMRTHTGEKPFKCIECGKTFGQSNHLIHHMRTHTGEKPFKCIECGKTFGQNCNLIVHMRKHTGEKPFKCNECGKTFGHSSSLIYHRRTHTGE